MSIMEEILFWVQTKQAPCLMNYENVIKRQYEATYSSSRPKSTHSSYEDIHTPKKKKKRKLSDLEDQSPEKQKNLFFETSQESKKAVISICRSDTMDSDIDFNIKNSSVQQKSKRMKLQKNSRTTLHKNNKVFTSTPKVTTALRRSRRRTQHINYNTEVNISFQPMSSHLADVRMTDQTQNDNFKSPDILINGNSVLNHMKQATIEVEKLKTNQTAPNGQFEDLSDVSGFTANYIRSTKLQSTKTPRNLRNKGSRNRTKESGQGAKQDNAIGVCVNKTVNASKGNKAALNCSTDSSHIILNFTTLNSEKKGKSAKRVDTSTSGLKFIEPRVQKKIDNDEVNDKIDNKISFEKVNIPIKPRNTSRYPKRLKNTSTDLTTVDSSTDQSPDKRKSLNIRASAVNNSDRKENPDESISRTRSGKPIGLRLREPSNSVLVVNNATEEDSMMTVNVAVATDKDKLTSSGNSKKCRSSSGVKYVQRVSEGNAPTLHLQQHSGFAQCFSDSDNDSEPQKQRKFFC